MRLDPAFRGEPYARCKWPCQNVTYFGEEGSMSTTIYSGPVFEMARKQFQDVADYLQIPHDERDRLLYPKRAIAVSCPIHRDDGSTQVFQGYRVQHHLTLGPT